MTDKIIIDDVDVSGCENFISNYERHHNIDGSITYYNACECGIQGVENYQLECNYNACYYKQLKCLQNQYNAVVEQNKDLQQQLKHKEKECEAFQLSENEAKEIITELQILLQAEQQKVKELSKANEEKNEFLQRLGISATGEFKRIKHYIDKLKIQNQSLQQENRQLREILNKILKEIEEIVND